MADDIPLVIPIRPQATLKKEHGVWVYQGAASDISIPGLIDREREKRLRGNRFRIP
jgi:hypothetical protein